EAVSKGFAIIPARGMTKGQRENAKQAQVLVSASEMFPMAGKSAYSNDPNAVPVEVLKTSELTTSMLYTQEYVKLMAFKLIGKHINVRFVNARNSEWCACYGNQEFDFNVAVLKKNWFKKGL